MNTHRPLFLIIGEEFILMQDYVLFEEGTLPSLGKIYTEKSVNPEFKIRSMTTEEEMRRLSHSDRPLKVICEIIDDCLIGKPFGDMSVYDMCLGDYQYLLHKLRVATYGPTYKMSSFCPNCGASEKHNIDLDSLDNITFDDKFFSLMELKLPVTGEAVKMRYQTPRTYDTMTVKVKDFEKKSPDAKSDQTLLFTLCSVVESVNGEHLDAFQLENFLRKLPMRDTNAILKRANKIDNSIGVKTDIEFTCEVCGKTFRSPFLITPEFYGPEED